MNDAIEREEPDPQRETAWAEEIRRRIRAYQAGELKMIPVEEALEEAERLLNMVDEPGENATPGVHNR